MIKADDRKNLNRILADTKLHPDLIIYMSDSELVRPDDFIRAFSSYNLTAPCILITDPRQDHMEEKLLNSGINMQQLIKPVSLKEIKDAIQLSLDK